jgi:integrase
MSKPRKHYGKWRIRWTDEKGARLSETHDTREDALFALGKHELEVKEIQRGLRSPLPPDKSVGDLCDYWLKNRAPQKRSEKDDQSIIRRHLRPELGEVRLRDLSVAHVDVLAAKRAHLDKKTLHNVLTLLITMLNVAMDLGWLLKMPRIRKPRVPLFTADFRFLRTKDEIGRLLRAAKDEGELVFVSYATAVYTGLRQGEVAGLRWDAIDLENRRITVQRSFEGPTKSGEVRHVPILDVLLPILKAWRLQCPGQIVFPNEAGTMHGKSARLFQEVFHRVLDRAGFPKAQRGGKERRYIVFHDLRHTFASHWVMGGGDMFRLQKILGHKTVQMTMRYAHLAPDAFVGDYARLGAAAPEKGAVVLPIVAQA